MRRKIFAFLLLFVSLAYADNPAELNLFIDFSKSKGQGDFTQSEMLPDDMAQVSENVDLELKRNLSRRLGTSNLISTGVGGNPNRLLNVFRSTTNYEYLVFLDPEKLKAYSLPPSKRNNSADVFVPISGQTDMVSYEGIGYVVSESCPGIKVIQTHSTGTLKSEYVADIPHGKYSQIFLDRLIVAGSTDDALRLSFSEEFEPENFPSTNTILISAINDIALTGIGPSLLGVLPIYTRFTTKILVGSKFPQGASVGNINIRDISQTIGTVHHRTIKNLTTNRQYFLSEGPNGIEPGIYYFNGVGIAEATRQAKNFFRDGVNMSTTPIPVAYITDDKYCVFVAPKGSTIANMRICVDLNERVEISTGMPPVGDCYEHAGQVYSISGPGNSFQNIFIQDVSNRDFSDTINFDPELFSWRYKTKDYSMGDPSKLKAPDRVYVGFDNTPGTFTFVVNYDFGRSSDTYVINTSSHYPYDTPIKTIVKTENRTINKLSGFSQSTNFNFVNFELFGTDSSTQSINYLNFYAHDVGYE